MTRYINAIWTGNPGIRVSNAALLPSFEAALGRLPLDDPDFETLRDMVRFYLIGERSRCVAPDWDTLTNFQQRAFRYETQAEKALDDLSEQIRALPATDGKAIPGNKP